MPIFPSFNPVSVDSFMDLVIQQSKLLLVTNLSIYAQSSSFHSCPCNIKYKAAIECLFFT